MIFQFEFEDKVHQFNTNEYFDLSMPIKNGMENPNAYYINPPRIEPFCMGSFVGSVAQGGACNCEDISFNAHGNGTHTEGIGHISKERIPIYNSLKDVMLIARLITVKPQVLGDDAIINVAELGDASLKNIDACILRTLPNEEAKKTRQYSGSNPAYLSPELTKHLANKGIQHLLLDLPSVDREEDGGALLAHKAFWQYPEKPRMHATITEMIYAPTQIPDGMYVLNLQIASFDSDASPSRPLLFPIESLE